jgi:hypothetical protein
MLPDDLSRILTRKLDWKNRALIVGHCVAAFSVLRYAEFTFQAVLLTGTGIAAILPTSLTLNLIAELRPRFERFTVDIRPNWDAICADYGMASSELMADALALRRGELYSVLRDGLPSIDCERTTVWRYRQLARYITEAQTPEVKLIADTQIKDLEKMHGAIETAMYALLRQEAKRRAHLSPKSVSHVAALISVALNKAFRLDYIDINPMLRVKLPKVPKKKAVSLKEDEFRMLRKVCRGEWTFV